MVNSKAVGRTLDQRLKQWQGDRERASKSVAPHGLAEKRSAISDFRTHAKVNDIGEITRAQIVSFRDSLSKRGYKTPAVNKKVGQITTLLATARKAGWVDSAISGGIYVEVPTGANEREPSDDPLRGSDIAAEKAFGTEARSAPIRIPATLSICAVASSCGHSSS